MLSRSTADEKPSSTSSNTIITKPHEFRYVTTFTNTLPDLPYAPKFLKVKNRSFKSRFSEYRPTQLELDRRRPLCDLDGGVTIDLIDPITYASRDKEKRGRLNEKDAQLLEDESAASLLKLKRSQQHAAAVPFMRRTEYIGADFNRFGVGADRQETKVGYNLLKNLNRDEIFYRDKDSQIKAIQKSFEDAKKPVKKHHSKPDVYAVEEISVFPDFENWKYDFTEVLFEQDPSNPEMPKELRELALAHSLIAGEEDFVGHFGPNMETLQRLLEIEETGEFDEEEILNYSLLRKYLWDVGNAQEDNDFAFYKKNDKIHYVPLPRKVKLQRNRAAGKSKQEITLECTIRDFNEKEIAAQTRRFKELMNQDHEDEEEEDAKSEKEGGESDGSEKSEIESPVKEGSAEKNQSESSSSSASSSSSSSASGSESD